MDIATCTLDTHTYTAVEFAALPLRDLTIKRRHLVCDECGNAAFFRKASRDGRGACFGARPHKDGCLLAAQDNDLLIPGVGDDEDELVNLGDRIVIDLNFGGETSPPHIDGNPGAPRRPRGGRHTGEGPAGTGVMHRRPSGLLRMLVDATNFRYSDQIIELPNQAPMPASQFFVELNDVTNQYEHQFRGYWGKLTDAGEGANGILWLNSGGRGEMSFRLRAEDQTAVMERYRLKEREDFVGAYILVLGTLRISGSGKMICFIDDLDMMAIR